MTREQRTLFEPRHVTLAELEAGLAHLRAAPRETGVLRSIVRRPKSNARETLAVGELNCEEGLVGDAWSRAFNRDAPDGAPNPAVQLTLMNVRAIELISPVEARRPLAGDQLYVDFDLGVDHLPAGAQVAVGEAIVEITAEPHLGCRKFAERFGNDAVKFVNSAVGKSLRLRGANARVVRPGTIRPGDALRKL